MDEPNDMSVNELLEAIEAIEEAKQKAMLVRQNIANMSDLTKEFVAVNMDVAEAIFTLGEQMKETVNASLEAIMAGVSVEESDFTRIADIYIANLQTCAEGLNAVAEVSIRMKHAST